MFINMYSSNCTIAIVCYLDNRFWEAFKMRVLSIDNNPFCSNMLTTILKYLQFKSRTNLVLCYKFSKSINLTWFSRPWLTSLAIQRRNVALSSTTSRGRRKPCRATSLPRSTRSAPNLSRRWAFGTLKTNEQSCALVSRHLSGAQSATLLLSESSNAKSTNTVH